MAILTFFYELADVLLKHFSFKKVNWDLQFLVTVTLRLEIRIAGFIVSS